jgi:thiol-disulfide isomerase/thioredoxin
VNIGPLAIPVAPLILLASFLLAVAAGRILSLGAAVADTPLFNSLLAGLIVSRLAFVAEYLPAFRSDWIKIFDIRDLGFDLLPGVVVGVLVLLWTIVRRAHVRRPLIAAALVGFLCWGAATAAVKVLGQEAVLPRLALVDVSSHGRTLARTDGKPLVVNLWASWCAPCRSEMPMLTDVQRAVPGIDLALVDQGESAATVSAYLSDQGLKADKVLLDPAMAFARSVDARGFPTTLFYDSQGVLLAVHLGPFSRATFQHAIETLYPELQSSDHASAD